MGNQLIPASGFRLVFKRGYKGQAKAETISQFVSNLESRRPARSFRELNDKVSDMALDIDHGEVRCLY